MKKRKRGKEEEKEEIREKEKEKKDEQVKGREKENTYSPMLILSAPCSGSVIGSVFSTPC